VSSSSNASEDPPPPLRRLYCKPLLLRYNSGKKKAARPSSNHWPDDGPLFEEVRKEGHSKLLSVLPVEVRTHNSGGFLEQSGISFVLKLLLCGEAFPTPGPTLPGWFENCSPVRLELNWRKAFSLPAPNPASSWGCSARP